MTKIFMRCLVGILAGVVFIIGGFMELAGKVRGKKRPGAARVYFVLGFAVIAISIVALIVFL